MIKLEIYKHINNIKNCSQTRKLLAFYYFYDFHCFVLLFMLIGFKVLIC